jgi:hypothetical protein
MLDWNSETSKRIDLGLGVIGRETVFGNDCRAGRRRFQVKWQQGVNQVTAFRLGSKEK